VDGEISPVLGARKLCAIWHEEESDDLFPFLGLESEWDDWHLRADRGTYAEELEAKIKERAVDLLKKSESR
jgi:hypothetical protein